MYSELIQHPPIGATIKRWLWIRDLNFEVSGHQPIPEVPRGFITDGGWVIFHRSQVVMPVPDEVHHYWHEPICRNQISSRVYEIKDSIWLASFEPRHLKQCHHFVLSLRDFVIEVICEALLFGEGAFELQSAINLHSELADAYLWRAKQREKDGDVNFADDLARLANAEGAFFQATAREWLKRVGHPKYQ